MQVMYFSAARYGRPFGVAGEPVRDAPGRNPSAARFESIRAITKIPSSCAAFVSSPNRSRPFRNSARWCSGILARVVGDDAAGVDDHGLDLRALPLRAPPGDVVADGILLRDVGLAPEVGAAIPRQRRRAERCADRPDVRSARRRRRELPCDDRELPASASSRRAARFALGQLAGFKLQLQARLQRRRLEFRPRTTAQLEAGSWKLSYVVDRDRLRARRRTAR